MIGRAAVIVAYSGITACAPTPARMMPFEKYSGVSHPVPYVLECEGRGSALLYFGSRHSYTVDDQSRAIEKFWDEFNPQAAYNEGENPPVAPSRDEAISRYGEAGLVRWLAARSGVPVATFEPTPRAEADHLAQEFSFEEIRVFYAMRALAQEAARGTSLRRQPDEVVRNVFAFLDQEGVAPGEPRTVEALQEAVSRLLPSIQDWRHPSMSLFDPVLPFAISIPEWTNRLARQLAEYRDEHIVRVLVDSANGGSRTFAVIGASHVVMQEPLLRSEFTEVRGPLLMEETPP